MTSRGLARSRLVIVLQLGWKIDARHFFMAENVNLGRNDVDS